MIATINTNTSSYEAHMYTETAVTDVIWVGRSRFQVLSGGVTHLTFVDKYFWNIKMVLQEDLPNASPSTALEVLIP